MRLRASLLRATLGVEPEMVVVWYHSHPGFGCWLSGVDINTQQRAVAVVVDPIQSVKVKVVIDAFHLINPQTMMLGQEPRQTTSNLGHLNKPSIQALIHGLNRHYYSIAINYRKNELEEILNLHKKKWTDGLKLERFDTHSKTNEQTVELAAAAEEKKFHSFEIDSAQVENVQQRCLPNALNFPLLEEYDFHNDTVQQGLASFNGLIS
ncbi:26S proteasome non-ATPase regulatory subunit 14 [Artemisia annua]|uniref:26S proteasome non-ATPase regulatory subunit 14 n=1 Tax=Artemisia annua TaxID=35608 RepID=A0A2U1QFF3_ARTAN|nr:26S proteasome non-ATPase regulatory subunit 14 [Artemisia annua]